MIEKLLAVMITGVFCALLIGAFFETESMDTLLSSKLGSGPRKKPGGSAMHAGLAAVTTTSFLTKKFTAVGK